MARRRGSLVLLSALLFVASLLSSTHHARGEDESTTTTTTSSSSSSSFSVDVDGSSAGTTNDEARHISREAPSEIRPLDEAANAEAQPADPTPTPPRRRGTKGKGKRASSSSSSSSSPSSASAEQPSGPRPILTPGRAIELPEDTKPRSFSVAPSRSSFIVVDEAVHGNLNAGGWFSWFQKKRPFPVSYLIKPDAAPSPVSSAATVASLERKLEFSDRQVLPLGVSEASDGRVGFTLYQGPVVEVWRSDLEIKLTYHETSVKPALPVFDNHGTMWTPYTIADRLGEEGPNVIAVWAYKPDGGRWEVFPRRSLASVKFPHTLHIDAGGRVHVAGLTSWIWDDGTYGQVFKDGVDPSASHVSLDVYEVTSHKAVEGSEGGEDGETHRREGYQQEQKGRYCESHSGDCSKEGVPNQGVEGWRDTSFLAAFSRVRSFQFPHPFNTCLWPLFVLTGDGHAVCSCYGWDTVVVVRISAAAEGGEEGGAGEGESDGTAGEGARTPAAPRKPQGLTNEFELSEAWGPPYTKAALRLVDDEDEAGNRIPLHVVATLRQPYDVKTIVGLQMDPTGKAVYILDQGRRRVVSLAWPLSPDAAVEEGVPIPDARVQKIRIPR